jgi:hypothetical protein
MEGASTLEILAELAVGVLGFSGIVAAIARRGSVGWSRLDRRRFFSMVYLGALVIVLALLPFPFHHAGLQAASVWGWSSGLGAIAIVLATLGLRRASPADRVPVMAEDPEVSKLALGYGLLATLGSPVLLVLNALGIFFERTFTPYLVAVLLNFGVALTVFVRLLQSAAFAGESGEPREGPTASGQAP